MSDDIDGFPPGWDRDETKPGMFEMSEHFGKKVTLTPEQRNLMMGPGFGAAAGEGIIIAFIIVALVSALVGLVLGSLITWSVLS